MLSSSDLGKLSRKRTLRSSNPGRDASVPGKRLMSVLQLNIQSASPILASAMLTGVARRKLKHFSAK
jgi:hypothetical protein